jgi:uncharacterized protein
MFSKSVLGAILAVSVAAYGEEIRLADAAMRGDQTTVQSLLKQKVDVNEAQADGNTALHWAAYRDDAEMARLLIQSGANPNVKTRLGDVTPLQLAATNGSTAIVELLLKAGAAVNAANGNGTTPLMFAAAAGRIDAIRILLDSGADVNSRDANHGQTAAMFAAALNRAGAIRLLASRGADLAVLSEVGEVKAARTEENPNVPRQHNGNPFANNSPAAAATPAPPPAAARQHNGNPFATNDVVDDKPAPAAPKPDNPPPPARNANAGGDDEGRGAAKIGGHTALHFAARDGHMQAVQALVESGSDVNQVSAVTALSPLMQAITTGHYDIAKYLLEHGADPNLATKRDGLTPLYATIDARFAPRVDYPSPSVDQENTTYFELMKELLDRGAQTDMRLTGKPWFRFGRTGGPDPTGSTAFWRAAQANDLAAMKLLVARGANPNLATTHGSTALQAAAGMMIDFQGTNVVPEAGLEVAKYLVDELGADVNGKDDKGYTVLHAAAFVGHNDVIMYLVSHGADVKARASQISNGASARAAKPGEGDTVADMANGWTEKVLQFPETVALLRSLGSEFSNTCFASLCVNPTRLDKKPQ